jgi:hypothetical protein
VQPRFTHLGHASWHVRWAGGALVTDPILSETYHDGVFEVYPRRSVDPDALDLTVVVVTHRHPDHFDVHTLALLAERYPRARVLTSDALIVETARALGFTNVEPIGELEVVDLGGGLQICTSPSLCSVEEWGVLFATEAGTVWNLVDSAVKSPTHVDAMLAAMAERLDRPTLTDGPDVAFVRWCPLRQADGATSGTLGFPHEAYANELRNAAATRARTLIPGSCGDRYTGSAAWQNATVYPVTEARFLADLAVLAPDAERFAPTVGHAWDLVDGRFVPRGPVDWVVRDDAVRDDRTFAPFVLPPIEDPLSAPDAADRRAAFDPDRALVQIATWCGDVLAPALARWVAAHVPGTDRAPLVLVLEVVFPRMADPARDRGTVGLTFRIQGSEVSVSVGTDPDHDALERHTATDLLAVLDGRAHWGAALLGGRMRSVRRGGRIDADGRWTPLSLPAFFVYTALPYERATERWVRGLVAALRPKVSDQRADRQR